MCDVASVREGEGISFRFWSESRNCVTCQTRANDYDEIVRRADSILRCAALYAADEPAATAQAVAYDGARAAHRALQRRNINHKTLACGETLTAFLTDLRLDDFQPLLQRLPAGTFEGASGPPMGSRDLRRFLVSVARAASGNSQLLEMLGDCKDRLATPSDEEVHRIVHYCLCLH